jgi:hypothetical protein
MDDFLVGDGAHHLASIVPSAQSDGGALTVTVPSVAIHEVIAIDL